MDIIRGYQGQFRPCTANSRSHSSLHSTSPLRGGKKEDAGRATPREIGLIHDFKEQCLRVCAGIRPV